MIKKISAILIAAALLGGVTSCYMPDAIFPDSAFDTEEEDNNADDVSLYNFEFTLSDVEYELPMKYDIISARGWKLVSAQSDEDTDADESDLAAAETTPAATTDNTEEPESKEYKAGTMMEPGEYSDYVMASRAGEYIGLKFYNDGKRSQALENCLLVGVMIEKGSHKAAELELEGDITLGQSYEDVATTYGKPSYTKDFVKSTGELAAINDIAFVDNYDSESDQFVTTLYYSISDTSTVSFELDSSNSVTRITMDNQDEVEEEFDDTKELRRRSTVVTLYKSPNLLGKTFDDFAFKYENNLYTLPIPVQKLIDDGWVFVRGAAGRIPMGTTKGGIVMRKGNLSMTLLVHNYDLKRAQTPVNCYAVSLSASAVGPNVKILMPKGVTLGSDYSDLVTAFGDEYAELSGYVEATEDTENGEETEAAAANGKAVNTAAAEETAAELAVGTVEEYELTEQEGCRIVKTVEEEYTLYSYIMPDDEPSITLPVSITDIQDPKADLLGENRKHIDVYISNANGKVMEIYLQNCPQYVVNETEILEQQMAAAEKAAQEAAEKAAAEPAETTEATKAAETTEATETAETTEPESSAGAVKSANTKTAKTTKSTTTKSTRITKSTKAVSSAGRKKSPSVVQYRLEVLGSLQHKG